MVEPVVWRDLDIRKPIMDRVGRLLAESIKFAQYANNYERVIKDNQHAPSGVIKSWLKLQAECEGMAFGLAFRAAELAYDLNR